MAFNIKDKVVLVTGASSGIGKETARAFAKRGAKVALTARNIEALKEVGISIKNDDGVSKEFPFDLANIEKIPELVENVQQHFGEPINILVNSAGIAVLGLVEDVPIEAYNKNLLINFFAPLGLIKAVVSGMKKRRRGQIINISSGVGRRGLPGVSPYCVSKFALNGLTESLRVELAPYGIDVILFFPGLVKTSFSDRVELYGELKEDFADAKMITPVEVAGKIIEASEKSKREATLSFRTKVSYHINYWAPRLLDYILIRKMLKNG